MLNKKILKKNFVIKYKQFITIILMSNLSNNKCIRTLFGHRLFISALEITQNHKVLFSCSADDSIKIWNIEKSKLIRTFSSHTDTVQSIAISQNFKYIVSGSADLTIKINNI